MRLTRSTVPKTLAGPAKLRPSKEPLFGEDRRDGQGLKISTPMPPPSPIRETAPPLTAAPDEDDKALKPKVHGTIQVRAVCV